MLHLSAGRRLGRCQGTAARLRWRLARLQRCPEAWSLAGAGWLTAGRGCWLRWLQLPGSLRGRLVPVGHTESSCNMWLSLLPAVLFEAGTAPHMITDGKQHPWLSQSVGHKEVSGAALCSFTIESYNFELRL